ncbi:hypothetical protein BDR04DRAFT_1121366 [Suillus decipiens]|nr:hypothetical protein BDR04DRAFT_1121366 [Suillus decipiens]
MMHHWNLCNEEVRDFNAGGALVISHSHTNEFLCHGPTNQVTFRSHGEELNPTFLVGPVRCRFNQPTWFVHYRSFESHLSGGVDTVVVELYKQKGPAFYHIGAREVSKNGHLSDGSA